MGTKQKVRIGQVKSNKMSKTVIVSVKTSRFHPLYKKRVKQVRNCKAHDEKQACKVGDTVRIVETRPLSKEKKWRVKDIISSKELVELKAPEVV